MPKKKKMFLVDGSNHAFRVQFALPPMHASDGFPTRVLYGFTLLFQKMMRLYRPDYAVVSFDSGKTFRHETYPDYKGHRPDMPEDLGRQWPWLPKLVEGFGYPCVIREGFEADDVLGTLAAQFASDELEVYLVTGDKDFAQLVTPNIKVLDEKNNKIMDEAGVREKFGVDPTQMIDLLGLSGDASDNIPGVPGIGAKTAAKLLEQWGTLEGTLKAAEAGKIAGKRGENLVESAGNARLSRELVTIKTDLDLGLTLDALTPTGIQEDPLRELFDWWEFGMVARKLLPEKKTVDTDCYRAVKDAADLDAVLAAVRKAGRVAIDVQRASGNARNAGLVGISLAWGPSDAVWVPLESRPGIDLDPGAARTAIAALLADPSVGKLGHDMKPVIQTCNRAEMPIANVVGDTMLLDYALIPHLDHGLDSLSQRQLGHSLSHGDAQGLLVMDEAVRQAVEPAHVAFLLDKRLQPRLDEGTRFIYEQVELPLLPILVEMEERGIAIDLHRLGEVRKDIQQRALDMEKKCQQIAGEPFNVGSPRDVSRILFDVLDLPKTHSQKRKTGWSTDATVLEKLEEYHELPTAILEYRQLQGLDSRYLSTLPDYVEGDGRIHTTYRQATAATGRLASADPNLQNIPIRSFEGRRIRECFVPAPGHVFLSADYSQVELRVLAHYTGAPALIESFRHGEDIHRRTASEVFKVPMEEVTFEQRNAAKAINFGLMYGMSAFRLGRDLNISRAEAEQYMQDYFGRMPTVQEWIEASKEACKRDGYVTTLYGRRRLIPEIYSKTFSERAQGEREAVNTRVQGTAADIIKLAMIRVDGALKASDLEARLLLQVHDELLLEVPEAEVGKTLELVVREMEAAAELAVPLDVNGATGANWNEAHG
ncbi:MAG: DNA polymerase I [Alphaproteobacteria bacterium]|nr:DNA polymerase I [Alphaproteobacteria bacterium]